MKIQRKGAINEKKNDEKKCEKAVNANLPDVCDDSVIYWRGICK